jgi:hypothetical protein
MANSVARTYMRRMSRFNYDAPAEIFGNKGTMKGRRPLGYRRFPTGAEALRFAIEEVPSPLLAGIILESDEGRYDHVAIRSLYDRAEYPLARNDAAN